jgi:hypothetical protein
MMETKENSNTISTEAEEITDSDTEAPTKPPKKPSTLFYLFYVLVWLAVIGTIAATIIPSVIGQKPQTNPGYVLTFWVAILTGMTARIFSKSGWVWFFIGICFGLVSVFLLSFIASILRNM